VRFWLGVGFIAFGLIGAVAAMVAIESERMETERRDMALRAVSLRTVRAILPSGEIVSLAPPGGGYVLVVSSNTSCGLKSIRRIAEAAAGRSLTRLYIVDLSGAEGAQVVLSGPPALQAVGLGPGDSASIRQALQLTSIPALFQINADGKIVQWEVGELSNRQVALILENLTAR
jgi:hypothetical protein